MAAHRGTCSWRRVLPGYYSLSAAHRLCPAPQHAEQREAGKNDEDRGQVSLTLELILMACAGPQLPTKTTVRPCPAAARLPTFTTRLFIALLALAMSSGMSLPLSSNEGLSAWRGDATPGLSCRWLGQHWGVKESPPIKARKEEVTVGTWRTKGRSE